MTAATPVAAVGSGIATASEGPRSMDLAAPVGSAASSAVSPGADPPPAAIPPTSAAPTAIGAQAATAASMADGDGAARTLARSAADLFPGQGVSVVLEPAELGRVRVALTLEGGAMTLTVTAERPETDELLRRHADVLAAALAEEGLGDTGFSFGKTAEEPQEVATDLDGEPAPQSPVSPQSTNRALDLRL